MKLSRGSSGAVSFRGIDDEEKTKGISLSRGTNVGPLHLLLFLGRCQGFSPFSRKLR
ncbi:Hypothetical protein SMAX5B_016397 [Scophthalmus maximus]|uniref:Uncharacterized protein n=1 Tax=Scophthalmus maximus TaxID=52904 RepID=A0A2U9C3H2_SCOMX|nr:Hypothetical protein SMAX5B_016397 [Scophthalmus maximus]